MNELSLSLETMGVNLPYSMQAEQAVLGAAILDADTIPKMVELLRAEMFYARQNGEIFSEIVRLFTGGAPVDFVTLLGAVEDAGVFDGTDEGKVYLTTLAETVPSISHVDSYIKIIHEKYLVRQLMNAAKTILEQTGEESDKNGRPGFFPVHRDFHRLKFIFQALRERFDPVPVHWTVTVHPKDLLSQDGFQVFRHTH